MMTLPTLTAIFHLKLIICVLIGGVIWISVLVLAILRYSRCCRRFNLCREEEESALDSEKHIIRVAPLPEQQEDYVAGAETSKQRLIRADAQTASDAQQAAWAEMPERKDSPYGLSVAWSILPQAEASPTANPAALSDASPSMLTTRGAWEAFTPAAPSSTSCDLSTPQPYANSEPTLPPADLVPASFNPPAPTQFEQPHLQEDAPVTVPLTFYEPVSSPNTAPAPHIAPASHMTAANQIAPSPHLSPANDIAPAPHLSPANHTPPAHHMASTLQMVSTSFMALAPPANYITSEQSARPAASSPSPLSMFHNPSSAGISMFEDEPVVVETGTRTSAAGIFMYGSDQRTSRRSSDKFPHIGPRYHLPQGSWRKDRTSMGGEEERKSPTWLSPASIKRQTKRLSATGHPSDSTP